MQAWARDPKDYGKSKQRSERPTKDKESQKWIHGYTEAKRHASCWRNSSARLHLRDCMRLLNSEPTLPPHSTQVGFT